MELITDIVKGDLRGEIALKFKPGSTINDYCTEHIPNYDASRLEVLAIHFYYGNETIITVYAVDSDRMQGTNFTPEKTPVKKFKLGFEFLKDILPFIKECNFTLTTGKYLLEDMEIINK
jgi:hypothetical protein